MRKGTVDPCALSDSPMGPPSGAATPPACFFSKQIESCRGRPCPLLSGRYSAVKAHKKLYVTPHRAGKKKPAPIRWVQAMEDAAPIHSSSASSLH